MRSIVNPNQLHSLQNDTFVYAAIVAVMIFFLAFLLANCIPYRGGDDKSYITRRILLGILVFGGSVLFWLYNDLYVMDYIKKPALQSQFARTNFQCLGITIFGSLLLSIIFMFVFRHSKFGSILGKKKNA